LPTPGLAHDRNHLTMALARPAEGLPQELDFRVPAHEPRQTTGRGCVEPATHGAGTTELEDLDRGRQALHGHGAAGRHLHEALGECQRLRSEQDGPWPGHLLHARGQVGRLADGRIVHVEIRADRADDYLARIQPYADLDRDTVRSEDAIGVSLDGLLHTQRSVAGANRVVLMRHRCSEQRHDPVAHHLVYRPLVAVDGLHHQLEDRVQDLASLLWVAVGEERH
jgi:hypothetical protein